MFKSGAKYRHTPAPANRVAGNAAVILLSAQAAVSEPNMAEFVMLLILTLFLYWMMGRFQKRTGAYAPPAPEAPPPAPVAEVMAVSATDDKPGLITYYGTLKVASDKAYTRLKTALQGKFIALLQSTWRGPAIVLIPGSLDSLIPPMVTRSWVHYGLAAITLISTTIAGALQQGYSTYSMDSLITGLSYSVPLLAILGLHECGHYFAARRHDILVTPPYFIPVPFGLGTFGAFISIKSPPENRTGLFDLAVAGPLAGFLLSIPILFIGLTQSELVAAIPTEPGTIRAFWDDRAVNSSILLSMMVHCVKGAVIPADAFIKFTPLALSGWIGFWITAINLIPVGQLDGGHIAQSMFGSKWSMVITRIAQAALLLMAIFVWPGFFVWWIILALIAGATVPPLDDITPISKTRLMLGWAAFSLIILILCPAPRL